MKKTNSIYSVILVLFILVGSSLTAYAGGHDSLLYDGATTPTDITEDCYVRVTYTKGTTNGTYYVKKTYQICGEVDSSKTTETGKLSLMNELKLGEEISTGENSSLEMQFPDGSLIRLGPNSKIKITGDMCQSRTLIQLMLGGSLWTKVKKLLGSQKYEVRGPGTAVGVRGTEFSVESSESGDIVKVFEGSVEVKSSAGAESKGTEDAAKEFQKLTEDFQAGKITMEEYMKKSQEFQNKMGKVGEDIKGKMCESGFMITVTDNVGEPTPIDAGSNWFDDVNFK